MFILKTVYGQLVSTLKGLYLISITAYIQIHCKKELVGPTNGLLINNLSGVLNQHMPTLGIVMITM